MAPVIEQRPLQDGHLLQTVILARNQDRCRSMQVRKIDLLTKLKIAKTKLLPRIWMHVVTVSANGDGHLRKVAFVGLQAYSHHMRFMFAAQIGQSVSKTPSSC